MGLFGTDILSIVQTGQRTTGETFGGSRDCANSRRFFGGGVQHYLSDDPERGNIENRSGREIIPSWCLAKAIRRKGSDCVDHTVGRGAIKKKAPQHNRMRSDNVCFIFLEYS